MKTAQKYTTESIQCQPVNMEKLNQDINAHFHKTPDNITYSISRKFAIIHQPCLSIIDEEFIGHDIKDKIVFDIHKSEKHPADNQYPNGYESFGMFPCYEVKMSLPDIEPYLDTPVSLAEFTKERRGYNGRIQGNEFAWLEHFNSI